MESSMSVDSILNKWNNEADSLISILLDIQSEYNYLPKEALITVAEILNIPLIQVYSAATFYKVFSLKPRGKHIINVCIGTACHVRGGERIVDEVKKKLGIDVGETTRDKLFTLETVRCLGCCALGPVVLIDNTYYSHVTQKMVGAILNEYKKGENK
ncbi:NADH-quinone oxidoreductase subunit NuoE [candidate division WOR-3 bacterium]|nr:NADH-quinone oxidoreductase subunit NuoE [candidate division WOR-3 bacterium]